MRVSLRAASRQEAAFPGTTEVLYNVKIGAKSEGLCADWFIREP